MSQYQKEIVQAVLIADNNVWNFKPLSDEGSTVRLVVLFKCCFPTGFGHARFFNIFTIYIHTYRRYCHW